MRIEIHLCISLDMSGRENFYILLDIIRQMRIFYFYFARHVRQ